MIESGKSFTSASKFEAIFLYRPGTVRAFPGYSGGADPCTESDRKCCLSTASASSAGAVFFQTLVVFKSAPKLAGFFSLIDPDPRGNKRLPLGLVLQHKGDPMRQPSDKMRELRRRSLWRT